MIMNVPSKEEIEKTQTVKYENGKLYVKTTSGAWRELIVGGVKKIITKHIINPVNAQANATFTANWSDFGVTDWSKCQVSIVGKTVGGLQSTQRAIREDQGVGVAITSIDSTGITYLMTTSSTSSSYIGIVIQIVEYN